MANKQYQAQKKPLQFSKGAIDRAARSIRHGVDGDERVEAIKSIQNFREFHLYPLMLLKNHLSRTSDKVGKNIIVARRLKQLPTIIDKLERPALNGQMGNTTRITSMQDIAGCRAIVRNLKQLDELRKKLEQSRSVHEIVRIDDYLIPKDSGYGGVHLIYNCFEGSEEQSDWKNAKVEIQLRTDLQHAWATSLEIIDTLEGIKLKTTLDGYPEWRKFFCLSGRLVAHDEGAITLSEQELSDVQFEVNRLRVELDIVTKLANYTVAIRVTNGQKLPKKIKNHQGLFLIQVKKIEGIYKTSISPYKSKDSDRALEALSEADLERNNEITVLVSAENIRSLRKAYPNYFGSTKKFLNFLNRHAKEGFRAMNQ
ncbi:GTP pyrophosphokinase [Alginatibacterium sediminis]|uniref:GTP pyrophosphokinase n=1 Tax=Alginatibacterium sediminis TaxID=2164068 RepID=A0A420E7U1_9ALTE|nr:RelA/SpoT domain-containing protein [Alginatibacterium sediminis]RKF14489.1 GTP pyrophosphokinase [Alginatibacterium sediminis]